jgi:hypothetical protein
MTASLQVIMANVSSGGHHLAARRSHCQIYVCRRSKQSCSGFDSLLLRTIGQFEQIHPPRRPMADMMSPGHRMGKFARRQPRRQFGHLQNV